jgi:rare lipoprotein A
MRRWIEFLFLIGGLARGAGAQTLPAQWERGLASWYGAPYDGQKAASGEIYHQEELTAAHRTLPFGSLVRVHRLDRNTSVVVRINDRGPFLSSRVIDLSRAAAMQLGMETGGVVPVTLEVVETPAPAASHAADAPPRGVELAAHRPRRARSEGDSPSRQRAMSQAP